MPAPTVWDVVVIGGGPAGATAALAAAESAAAVVLLERAALPRYRAGLCGGWLDRAGSSFLV